MNEEQLRQLRELLTGHKFKPNKQFDEHRYRSGWNEAFSFIELGLDRILKVQS